MLSAMAIFDIMRYTTSYGNAANALYHELAQIRFLPKERCLGAVMGP